MSFATTFSILSAYFPFVNTFFNFFIYFIFFLYFEDSRNIRKKNRHPFEQIASQRMSKRRFIWNRNLFAKSIKSTVKPLALSGWSGNYTYSIAFLYLSYLNNLRLVLENNRVLVLLSCWNNIFDFSLKFPSIISPSIFIEHVHLASFDGNHLFSI